MINENLEEISSVSTTPEELIESEDGNKKVTSNINNVADIVNSTLNAYEGMKKLQIEVNGESKEIWLDDENLRVDSSTWEFKENGEYNVKVNPEGDIIEYLDGPLAGQQSFDSYAAERESKKIGKRLPFVDSENKEFQAIIEKVGVEEFTIGEEDTSYWTSSSASGNNSSKASMGIDFFNGDSRYFTSIGYNSFKKFVRLVKD